MCTRTVIEIEKCNSNPKFETVALISEEMDISLEGIVFHDRAPQTVAKCVLDYFAGKGEEESQRYIDLCMSCLLYTSNIAGYAATRIARSFWITSM